MATEVQVEGNRPRPIVIGVDTHKYVHVAAAMDAVGATLATRTIATDSAGFEQLLQWAAALGTITAFGVEGTGSYGAGLTSWVRRHGYKVVEVARPDRRLRRLNGKSDPLDAENAARAVLAGSATAIPKTADGSVEMIRHLKVAHDTAVKARSAAIITLKAILVHAPEPLRLAVAGKTQRMLARQLAALRACVLATPADSIRYVLRSIAKRWLALDQEIGALADAIQKLVLKQAPHLVEAFGIGVDTAAEILIVAGDNPERIKSEAALAKLAGISPVPTGSGMTSGKYRINHGGHRQLNAAIYRTVIVRMQHHEPTKAYVTRRTTQGKSKRDIIRCLKRYVIREVYHLIRPTSKPVEIAT